MNSRPALTLAYLTHAPASAAQVLERLEAGEAAAFLGQIPARLAAPVVGGMSPWAAARVIGRLSAGQAAAILQHLAFHDSVGIVRLIPEEGHAALFEALPARLSRRLEHALGFPVGSVGAWIDPEVPLFAGQTTAGDALKSLREFPGASHVFLQPRSDARFVGALPLTSLLRGDPARSLAELPSERVRALSSRAALASVAAFGEWDHYLMLPVADRRGTVIGGLSRASLSKGLDRRRGSADAVPGTLAGHLLSALGVTCAGLLREMANADS